MDKNSDYIFKAFIVNSAEYDNGNKETSGTWLYFPTTKEEVSAAFEKIGLPQYILGFRKTVINMALFSVIQGTKQI